MTVTEPTAPTLEPPQSDAPPPAGGRKRARRRAPATNGDTKPKGPGRPSNIAKLTTQLEDQFTALGMVAATFHPADGLAIIERAPALADALAKLAEQNPRVRRILEGGMTSSAWLGVALAFGGLGFELAKNHGLIGVPSEGVFPASGNTPDQETPLVSSLANLAARAQAGAA